ncbi:MAG TPA: TonB-dependent receptor [Candidatus Acidoferrales bacterium]|nr:TonB-dependent receptor [Candidatus Acidoferrales bacterium]
MFVFTVMTVFCARVDAQVTFGSVIGTVSDPSGATVAGATVKLTNSGTSETRSVQTDSGGAYAFPNLTAGQYRVTIEAAGFKGFNEDGVRVEVGVATRADAKLQVGSVTQTIEVTAEVPLQTDSASLGTTISREEVESIPLSGRNVENMLTLVPGVIAGGDTYGNAVSNQAAGARTNSIGFGNYAIGGGFGNQSQFYVDGVSSNGPANNLNSYIPSQDVVQEFRVETNNVPAEYGNYAGGVVNITTKSGTNTFHGTGYEYLRNKVLNANDYFSNLDKLPRAPLIQNQFGGTIGGPIKKDKTFFFFGFEREVIQTTAQATSTVPTPAELSGDFRAVAAAAAALGKDGNIYDHSLPGDPIIQCNGVQNVICPNRLDLGALKLFAVSYPTPKGPNATALVNNFIGTYATGGVNNQYNARVDHHFSDKDALFARYTYWKAQSDPYDAWGTHTQGQGNTGVYTQEATLGETHAFSPSMILDVRLAYLRAFEDELPDSINVDLSQFGAGWTSVKNQLVAPPNWPSLNFADGNGLGSLSGSNGVGSELYWHQAQYTLSGTLTKIAGRHQVKFGGQVRRVSWISSPDNNNVSVNFNQFATASSFATGATGGSSVASALLGIPASSGMTPFLGGGSRAYFTAYGFFVQDTFQATKRLTVTAGLRWDQPSTYSEARNNDTVFLPNQPSPLESFFNPVTGKQQQLMGDVALVASPEWPSQREDFLHWKLFSPRLGIAYRLTDRTVLRAAYGISYPPPTLGQDGPDLSPINGAPTSVTNTFSVQTGGVDNIQATVENPFPNGINQPLRRNFPPADFLGQAIFAMRVPGAPTPYVQQWNAAVEEQIGKDSSLTVAYAGSKGTHLLLQGWATVPQIGLNQLPEQYFSLGPAALLAQVPNPFLGIITTPGSPLAGPTVPAGQLLRPYPQFGRVLELDPHEGVSNYNALQVSFLKRFSGNGILTVAYTWSKLMSNTDSVTAFLDEGGIFGGSIQNNDNLKSEYSLGSYDIPQNLAIGYGVDLPFGRDKRLLGGAQGVLSGVVSGWRVNGITTIRSGVPIAISQFFAGSALSQLGGGTGYFGAQGLWMRPNILPGCNKSAPGSRQFRAANGWFNTACFPTVNTGTTVAFGNAPRVDPTMRQDYQNNWDFSIAKRTPITEGVNLQFTAEFFNLFNRTRFADPCIFDGGGVCAPFGIVTADAGVPRAIQFGLRLNF